MDGTDNITMDDFTDGQPKYKNYKDKKDLRFAFNLGRVFAKNQKALDDVKQTTTLNQIQLAQIQDGKMQLMDLIGKLKQAMPPIAGASPADQGGGMPPIAGAQPAGGMPPLAMAQGQGQSGGMPPGGGMPSGGGMNPVQYAPPM